MDWITRDSAFDFPLDGGVILSTPLFPGRICDTQHPPPLEIGDLSLGVISVLFSIKSLVLECVVYYLHSPIHIYALSLKDAQM
jgi:hypothetical protein